MLNLTSVAPWLQKQGVYGPVTATLDWCELNHQFSPYIAEMANTFSNLFTVGLALCGWREARLEGLPERFAIGYAGIGLVGIGSFLFHATLKFGAQLADELPMIYVGSMSLWLLFDDEPGFGLRSNRTKLLIICLALFDVLFTWTYMAYRNPVFHQVVFASLVLSTTFRITYILQKSEASRRIPDKKKSAIGKLFTTGAALFALGFLLWNMDNLFCHILTRWKIAIGWPLAFLLEGHSWWHVLTGSGTYFMYVGIQYVALCVKDNPQNYSLKFLYGLPHVRKLHAKAE